MSQTGSYRALVISFVVFFGVAGMAAAQSPVAAPLVGSAGIEWRPIVERGIELTVSGPDGFYLRQSFGTGESVVFSAFNEDGSLRPEGNYAFELKGTATLDAKQARDLAAVRERGDARAIAMRAGLPKGPSTSGYFSIIDGAIEMGSKVEPDRPAGAATLSPKGTLLTSNDGIIHNSLCVGFDCPTSPAFGDSTILMMENNTRIKFGDTSVSPFPNNDWEIEANSNLSGGQSFLGFNDCGTADNDGGCAADLVFAVEAGARQNALYVESDGDVGFGTSNPVANLHAVDGDSPTLRLEQDGSSGFAPQTWDIAGNETSFFIRDATNGSTLPFRIRPGASSNSLVIDSDDDVGIGVLSADAPLHVLRSGSIGSDGQVHIENNSGTASDRNMLRIENNGPPTLLFSNTNAASNGSWTYTVTNGGIFQINASGSGTPIELQLSEGGDMTIGGTLTENSSRSVKTGFESLDTRQILERLATMPVLVWSYSYDEDGTRHIGPMAEDFYAAFNVGPDDKHIAPSDKAGVALAAIQGLNQAFQEKDAEKDAEIEALNARIEKLESALALLTEER